MPGEAKQVVHTPQNDMLPSIEELHHLPVSIPYALKLFVKGTIWSYRPPCLWTGSKIQLPLDTQLDHFTLPETTSTAVGTKPPSPPPYKPWPLAPCSKIFPPDSRF